MAYPEPINWYRTILHELGHWTGHKSRLDRLTGARFGAPGYAREELCAEMASAFLCAELGIVPTVQHADYIGSWLEVLREDNVDIRARQSVLVLRTKLGTGHRPAPVRDHPNYLRPLPEFTLPA